MKAKLFSLLLIFTLALPMTAIQGFALQDPVILAVDSVKYGEGQNTLVVEGDFVNTSNKTVLTISEVQIEIIKDGTVIASKIFDISKERVFTIAVGDAVPWSFVMENPLKGVDLGGWKADTRVVYNQGKPIELATGKKIYYKGVPVVFDVKPAVINGRLMIPARAVFEKMGATVTWSEASKSLDVNRGDRRVTIFVNNSVMTVDGKPVRLDVPATIIDGRTLVPLRAIANALGAGITYGELNEMAVVYE